MNIFTDAWHATLQFLHIEDLKEETKKIPITTVDNEKKPETIEIITDNLQEKEKETTPTIQIDNEKKPETIEIITDNLKEETKEIQTKKTTYITKTDIDLKDNNIVYFTEENESQNLNNQENLPQNNEIISFAEDNYKLNEEINLETINDQPQNIIDLNINF